MKAPMPEPFFDKVTAFNIIKKRHRHRCFSMNFSKFLTKLFSKQLKLLNIRPLGIFIWNFYRKRGKKLVTNFLFHLRWTLKLTCIITILFFTKRQFLRHFLQKSKLKLYTINVNSISLKILHAKYSFRFYIRYHSNEPL